MNPQVTRLPNGLRIVSQHMPHAETISLGVWVGVGGRHESVEENGISHLLEHMAFKGTIRRSARDIAEEIEQVGGDLNAATSLEMTSYYSRVLKADLALAIELLADILQNPRYSEDDLEKEREVILQEIASTRDSPEEIAYDLLNEVAYPSQPVGRPILGTTETVSRLSTEDLRRFLAAHYAPERMVISAAGAVDHESLVRHAEAQFDRLNPGTNGDSSPARYVGGPKGADKTFEQTHLLLGLKGPSYRDADFYTAQVFSGLFGGGMSSRLFQEARERRGLCYSIYSSCWALGDTGMLGIYAATGQDMMGRLIDVIRSELELAARRTPDVKELERSKAQLKAGLLMSLESSGARAEQMARQVLLFDRIVPPAELIGRVESVTAEGLTAFARKLISGDPATAIVVGAGRKSRGHARMAAAAVRDSAATA
jgi:predicted Zn-dependent peptidase